MPATDRTTAAATDRPDGTRNRAEPTAAHRCCRRICADWTGASVGRLHAALLDAARCDDPLAARAKLAAALAAKPEAPTAVGAWLRRQSCDSLALVLQGLPGYTSREALMN